MLYQSNFIFISKVKNPKSEQKVTFQSVKSQILSLKRSIFAKITLDDREYSLYNTVYENVITDLPKPDVVIYLQAPTSALMGGCITWKVYGKILMST